MKLQVRIRSILFNFFSIFYFGKEKNTTSEWRGGFALTTGDVLRSSKMSFFLSFLFCFVSFFFGSPSLFHFLFLSMKRQWRPERLNDYLREKERPKPKKTKTKNTTKSTDWFIKKENKGKQLRNVEIGGGGAWEKNFLTTVAPFITLVRERWVVSRLSGLWPNQRRPMKQKKNETK